MTIMMMLYHGNTFCITGHLWGESTGHWLVLMSKQNGPHFTNSIFKHIFLKENFPILIHFGLLKFASEGPTDNVNFGSADNLVLNGQLELTWK